jgi:hypothetical protein
MEDGWSAKKTSNGHIKLTHKDASYPVYTSSTPSNHRSYKNMLSDCKRSLRQPAPEAQSEIPVARKPAEPEKRRKRKKQRWSAQDRLSRHAATLLPDLPDKSRIATTSYTKALKQLAEENQQPQDAKKEKQSMIKKSETAQRIEAMNAATAPAAPKQTAKQPVVQNAANALPQLPGDILDIALRIVKGEIKTFEITPEMVGQTLVLDGQAWLSAHSSSEQAKAAKPVLSLPGNPPKRGKRGKDTHPEMLALKENILEIMKTFTGEWLVMRQVADLIDGGELTQKHHRDRVRRILDSLCSSGEIRRQPIDGQEDKLRKQYKYMLNA